MKTTTVKQKTFFAFLLLIGWIGILVGPGCASLGRGSTQKVHLRVYLEASVNDPTQTMVAPVYRKQPVLIRIQKEPILDERDLVHAAVVKGMGGYSIELVFDFHGKLVLQQVSNAYRGRRLVLQAVFPEARWLGIVRMNRPIMDGVLTFTPDATQQEAQRIVDGLNRVARKLGNYVPLVPTKS